MPGPTRRTARRPTASAAKAGSRASRNEDAPSGALGLAERGRSCSEAPLRRRSDGLRGRHGKETLRSSRRRRSRTGAADRSRERRRRAVRLGRWARCAKPQGRPLPACGRPSATSAFGPCRPIGKPAFGVRTTRRRAAPPGRASGTTAATASGSPRSSPPPGDPGKRAPPASGARPPDGCTCSSTASFLLVGRKPASCPRHPARNRLRAMPA